MRLTISYAALLGGATGALAAFGLLALPPALDALAEARGRALTAERLVAAPMMADRTTDAGGLAAGDRRNAATMLQAILRRQAVAAGVLAEDSQPLEDMPEGVIGQRIVASGDARALLRFTASLEADGGVRFVNWRLARPKGGSAMRLSGDVVARWRAA